MKRVLIILGVLFLGATFASADSIPIFPGTYPGDPLVPPGHVAAFSGLVDYNQSTTTLTISLTNTTVPSIGGYITGFAFDIHGNASDTATLVSATTPFVQLTPPINGQPYGTFEVGSALSGSNLQGGGGNPAQGIAVGSTGTFVFTISGPDAAALTAADFVGDLNKIPSLYANQATLFQAFPFIVRFRSLNSNILASDKVPAFGLSQGQPPFVPLPTAAMGGLALLGLVAVGKFKGMFHA